MNLRHISDGSRAHLDDRARKALARVEKESGKSLQEIAGAMDYSGAHLRELASGGAWSAQAIAALAHVTDQDPVEMLAREIGEATQATGEGDSGG